MPLRPAAITSSPSTQLGGSMRSLNQSWRQSHKKSAHNAFQLTGSNPPRKSTTRSTATVQFTSVAGGISDDGY